MTEIVVAVTGGAVLFGLFAWLGLRRSPCSLEEGGRSCSSHQCAACPNASGASEETHDSR
jgi:hypothetical protein